MQHKSNILTKINKLLLHADLKKKTILGLELVCVKCGDRPSFDGKFAGHKSGAHMNLLHDG